MHELARLVSSQPEETSCRDVVGGNCGCGSFSVEPRPSPRSARPASPRWLGRARVELRLVEFFMGPCIFFRCGSNGSRADLRLE
jgi:hypothetical protein